MNRSFSISRRNMLIAGASAAGAAILPSFSRAQASPTLTTAFGWIPNVQYAGHWIALERGYFGEEGLNAEHLPGGPNAPNALVTLSTGNAQVAYGQWLPFLDARDRGNDFVMIAANFPVNPTGFMSLPGRPIRNPADLVGTRILAQNESDKQIIETIFKLNNLPIDYTFVPAGFSPEPLLAGDGDVYICFMTNQPITLEKMGLKADEDFIVASMADFGYIQPGATFITDRATLESRRDDLVAYLKALIRGWTENERDAEVAARLTVEKYGADLGLDLQQQIRQNELQIPYTRARDGRMFWIDPADVTGPMYTIAREAGRSNLPEDVGEILDTSLLQEAHASL